MTSIDKTFSFFFFNDTATTEIYTLSLHDALPICDENTDWRIVYRVDEDRILIIEVFNKTTRQTPDTVIKVCRDRKSTRLNSSHVEISYAVFCLKKKKSKNLLFLKENRSRPAPPAT